jgi:hypothetical protein
MSSWNSGVIQRLTGKRIRALVAAGALTAAGVAGTMVAVNAQQPSPSPSPSAPAAAQQRTDDYLSRLAQNLGITVDRLRAAMQQTALQEVDAALQRGDITAERAQQARDRINSGEVGRFGIGFGRGRGGEARGGGLGASHEEIAQFLNVTADQLRSELNGASLAQVAQNHGSSRAQLIQFLTTQAQQDIAAAVQAGRLTQQQAEQRLADIQSRIEQMVDRVRESRQTGTRSPRPSPSGTGR